MGSHTSNAPNTSNIQNTSNISNTSNTLNTSDTSINQMNYIWIDQNVDDSENTKIYNDLLLIKRYLNLKRFKTVKEAFDYIKVKQDTNVIKNKFLNFTIITSGKLYFEFYDAFNKIIDKVKFFPIVVVFSEQEKLFIQKLKNNGLYDNNYLLDHDLIFNSPEKLKNYIITGKKEEKDFSFDLIDNYQKLADPLYYSSLFLEDVSISDIISFNQNIFYKYKNTSSLTEQLVNKNIPKIILYKYWLSLYTSNKQFYTDLNRDLRKSSINICTYFPFIKACYEGIRKQYFKPEIDSKLYRGQGMSKEEFGNIKKLLLKKNDGDMSKIIISAKCFLSFSKREYIARGFLSYVKEDKIKVLFIIENSNNEEIDKKLVTNAYIKEFSRFEDEEEVLFFPLSCFGVKEREEKNNVQEITLEYLANYKNLINNELKNLEVINNTEFSNYLINIGIIENDYIRPI